MPTNVFGTLTLNNTFVGGTVTKNGDLTIDVSPFYYTGNDTAKFSGSINTVVTNNATNYVYIESASLTISTSSFPSSGRHTRLATVLAQSGTIVSINDRRGFLTMSPVASGSDHVHANQAQLDLITDGEHDVRVDNPHSDTATLISLSNVDNLQQIPLSQKGAAAGVATLDSGTVLPIAQLLTASITPSQISSDQTDYTISGFSTAHSVRLNASSPITINSLSSSWDGRIVLLENVGANDITLAHEGAGTAAYRFLCNSSASFVIPPSGSTFIKYDGTNSRWRVVTPFPGNLSASIASVSASISQSNVSIATLSPYTQFYNVFAWKNSVDVATSASLPSYTRSGTPTGNVLTATANGQLVINSRTMFLSESVFHGAHSSSNPDFGIFLVTATGSDVAPWVLTARSDFAAATDIVSGAIFRVKHAISGSIYGNTRWSLATTGTITFRTTPLEFTQNSTLFVYKIFTASAAWERPEGITKLMRVGLRPGSAGGGGGGGGGAGFSGATAGGGGGGHGGPGGGGAATHWLHGVDVTPSGTYTINIGAGGPGGLGGSGGTGSAGITGENGSSGGYTEILYPDGTVVVRAGQALTIVGGMSGSGGNGGGAGTSGAGGAKATSGGQGGAPYGAYASSGSTGGDGGTGGAPGSGASGGSASSAVTASFVVAAGTVSGTYSSARTFGTGGFGNSSTLGGGSGGGGGGSGGAGDEYQIFLQIIASGGLGGVGGHGSSAQSTTSPTGGIGENGLDGIGGRGGGGGGGGGGSAGATSAAGPGGAGGNGGSGSIGQAIFIWEVNS